MGFAAIEGDDDSTKGELSIAVSWNDEFKRVIAYWKQPRLNRTRTSGEHPRPREPVGQPVAWRARAGKRLSLRRLWKPVSDAPARCTTGGTRDCTGNHMASPPLWRADEKLADWERRRGKPRLQIFEKVLAGGPDKERMCGRVASQPYATNERRGSLGVKPRWAQCTSWANLNFKVRFFLLPPSFNIVLNATSRSPPRGPIPSSLAPMRFPLSDSRPENSTRPVGSSPGTSSRLKAGRARRSVRTSARVAKSVD
ncbi:uncharacterized protein LOC119117041 isoform X3 [Syngnathus acus]|uniref:uncharacterized protein LOC119117041 isoform X3 n=1 Tax=Syngnathus acus TaxID=161584 RepID=UPI001885E275|nr:uncharacterized protein LOC119117041 isoform X3 [Syngnathus acus]